MRQYQLMYRGTLSGQHYGGRRARKAGQGATGPYFVWQGSLGGKHFSRRVNARQAELLKQGIEARHEFEALCAQYVALGQALAEHLYQEGELAERVKKTPTCPSKRAQK
jgi:hypothetical protein